MSTLGRPRAPQSTRYRRMNHASATPHAHAFPNPAPNTHRGVCTARQDAHQGRGISSWPLLTLAHTPKEASYADADTQQDERTHAEPHSNVGAAYWHEGKDTRQSGIISSWSFLNLMNTPQGACSEEAAPTAPSLSICLDHTSLRGAEKSCPKF